MDPTVVCLAGGIGSGKTTVARLLADHLQAGVASFGAYVREQLHDQGVPETREALQQLGAELLAAGLGSFCRSVVESGGWRLGSSVVVEGVRHPEALHAIRALVSPMQAPLIFLDVDREMRAQRLLESRPDESASLSQVEQHSTEVQVDHELRALADLIVDGTLAPDAIVEQIISWLSSK